MMKAPLQIMLNDEYSVLSNYGRMNTEKLMYLSIIHYGLTSDTLSPTRVLLLRERCDCIRCPLGFIRCLHNNGLNRRKCVHIRKRCCTA